MRFNRISVRQCRHGDVRLSPLFAAVPQRLIEHTRLQVQPVQHSLLSRCEKAMHILTEYSLSGLVFSLLTDTP